MRSHLGKTTFAYRRRGYATSRLYAVDRLVDDCLSPAVLVISELVFVFVMCELVFIGTVTGSLRACATRGRAAPGVPLLVADAHHLNFLKFTFWAVTRAGCDL